MQVTLSSDLEVLINKRLSTGEYASVEEVLRRALEAQDTGESWTHEERQALSAHVEERYQESERGDLIDGDRAISEIQEMKETWRKERKLVR